MLRESNRFPALVSATTRIANGAGVGWHFAAPVNSIIDETMLGADSLVELTNP